MSGYQGDPALFT